MHVASFLFGTRPIANTYMTLQQSVKQALK